MKKKEYQKPAMRVVKIQHTGMLMTSGFGASRTNYGTANDGFSSVGGTKMRKEFYWSSTERNAIMAWFYNFEDDNNHPDGHWHIDGKDITVNFYVRACLAF